MNIVNMLTENDRISIIAISEKASRFIDPDDEFQVAKMYTASIDNKMQIFKFIDNLNRSKEITNHTLGFQYSFSLLREIYENLDDHFNKNVPVFMVYISRGLLSPLNEARSVLEAIAQGQRLLKYPIIINTCAIVLGNIDWKIKFLRYVVS